MRVSRWITVPAVTILSAVGIVGAVLSFETLRNAAVNAFGERLSYGFPILVDLFILGCLFAYIHTVRAERPMNEWRVAAHVGVFATVALNLYASKSVSDIAWHAVPPLVWSALCEYTSRYVLGQYKIVAERTEMNITLRQWLTSPVTCVRAYILKARFGSETFWRMIGQHEAARVMINLHVPDHHARRVLLRQLRMGSLAPGAAVRACLPPSGHQGAPDGREALRAAFSDLVPAVPAPDSLGKDDGNVPGQGPKLIVVPTATKRDAVEAALALSGGNVLDALAILARENVDVTPSYVYRIKRESTTVQYNVTKLHERAGE